MKRTLQIKQLNKLDKFKHFLFTTSILLIWLNVIFLTACSTNNNNQLSEPIVLTTNTALVDANNALPQNNNISAETIPTETTNEALLTEVEILILESFPVQVRVLIKGSLPDGCVLLGTINQQQIDQVFVITVPTQRQIEGRCKADLRPFEKVITLNVEGLSAGQYTVTIEGANTVGNRFTLNKDNVLPLEPTPTPATATISGVVWEDFCRILMDGTPGRGCALDDKNGYTADGIFNQGEKHIANIQVKLSIGACPGENQVFTITTTDENGIYQFTNLNPGSHCVSIDPTTPENAAILVEGNWTHPSFGNNEATVIIKAGQSEIVNFGWYYQTVTTTPTPLNCFDRLAYVSDITIPDNTILDPGETFTKTWRVRNDGTCSWGTDYTLVFFDGNQMGGADSIPLETIIEAGEEFDLHLPLIAPEQGGFYRGEWLMQNAQGDIFGSRGDYALYLQIVVRGQ